MSQVMHTSSQYRWPDSKHARDEICEKHMIEDGVAEVTLVVLQMESCAVSTAMLDDINAQEASCRAAVERAQDKLKRLNLDAEVAKHQAALDDLQRRASALRQV